VICLSLLMAMTGAAWAGAEDDYQLKWKSNDATKTLGGFIQQRLTLSTNQPSSVKKLPDGTTAPLFGELKIGPREKPASYMLVLDEPKGKPSRLFLDANGNGDLADDPAPTWTQRNNPNPAGGTVNVYVGEAKVRIPYANGAVEAVLGFYRFDAQPGNAGAADTLFYYRDYFLSGDVAIAGRKHNAMLFDEWATGDFRGQEGKEFSGVRLIWDLNDDGRFDLRRESFDVRKPFNVGGTTWEFGNLTADGKFQLVRSTQVVPETFVPPNLARGAKALPFTAKTIAGAAVKFPDDYKGKVVLLDFWATWCGPCLAELPNVVANYSKFHSRGFEILGISLDKDSSIATLPRFTQEKNMPWPQICDGKMWMAELGHRYGVESIPFMLLVDGDSGEILGSTIDLRGEGLGPAIEAGLQRKPAPAKAK
jgi:peroxiredoxin